MIQLSRLTRLALSAALLLPACGDKSEGDSTASATDPSTSTGVVDPTTTSSTTVTPTSTGDSTTGEPPKDSCTALTDQAACNANDLCKWAKTVQYTHGAQGCQGVIIDFCVAKEVSGTASAWYREIDGDAQVVEFTYTPDDLPGEWTQCACGGPLACLCSSVAPDCPDQIDEFCGAIGTEKACSEVLSHTVGVCGWFSVSPEGPKDDKCSDNAFKDVCLPATNGGSDTCMPPAYTFNPCTTWPEDLFWREVDGVVEVITTCGPVPTGWTQCLADDTPDQPDECGCRCL